MKKVYLRIKLGSIDNYFSIESGLSHSKVLDRVFKGLDRLDMLEDFNGYRDILETRLEPFEGDNNIIEKSKISYIIKYVHIVY